MTKAGALHLCFLASFNDQLAALGCGARVAAIEGNVRDMEIVDLDGVPIGRVPTRIEAEAFAAFMLVVEQSFAEGARSAARLRNPGAAIA